MQLYAVIALAALALWFLFDRTVMGMAVSLIVGIGSWVGFMLIITPYVPSVSGNSESSGISHPIIDATGWMPSALFSANVAFGNIGRKLFERDAHSLRRRRYSISYNRANSVH